MQISYMWLQNKGIEVIYDDREVSAGVMFSDADLIRCSIQSCCQSTEYQAKYYRNRFKG